MDVCSTSCMNTKCCEKCEGTKWPTEPCICSCHKSAKKLHSTFCSFRSNEAPCKCPTADTAEKCTCNEQGYPKHKYDCPTIPVQLGGAELFPATDTVEKKCTCDSTTPHEISCPTLHKKFTGITRMGANGQPYTTPLPTTDTSDWRERLERNAWTFTTGKVFRDYLDLEKLAAFIENELERARNEERIQTKLTYKIAVPEAHERGVRTGRTIERARVREVVEGMKKLPSPETQRTGIEVLPGADAVRVIYNAALSDLLSTLEGK